MSVRDYYEVLGIKRDAPAEEVRRAYRAMARTLHPDVNKAPDAAERFAELQQAYDVLSDEKKRRLYDQLGHAGAAGHARPGPTYEWAGVGGRGDGPDLDDLGSMFDAFFGGRHSVGFGTASGPRAGRTASRGQDVTVEHTVSFLTAAKGGQEAVRSPLDGRTIEVTIPAGIDDGAKLRVRGAGRTPSRPGGRSGDLILLVRTGSHPLFRREGGPRAGTGPDLVLDLPLTIAEATLGGRVAVPALDGPIEVTVPPGTPSGRRLRVKGKGIPAPGGRVGDLYAVIRIVPPDPAMLSPEQRRLVEEIGRLTPGPRAGSDWPGHADR